MVITLLTRKSGIEPTTSGFALFMTLLLALLFFAGVYLGAAKADISPYTGAEVARNIAVLHIEDEGVRVELEIYPVDAQAFSAVIPEDMRLGLKEIVNSGPQVDLKGPGGISLARSDGSLLSPRFINADRRSRVNRASPFAGITDPITGTVVPGPPESPDVIYLELFYDFEGIRPDELVLRSFFSGTGVGPEVGFILFDRTVPVSRFSFLTGDARFKIDWHDPWFTAFSNVNLNRVAKDGTSAFLYVAPREIRHEILIRVRDLAPWLGQSFRTGETLDETRRNLLLDASLKTIRVQNPVTIDGKHAAPSSVRGSFLVLSETGFQIVEDARPITADTAFLGLIFSYPIQSIPQRTSVTWDMFGGTIKNVPMTLTDAAGPFLDWATPDAAKVTWTNHLKTYKEPHVTPVQTEGLLFLRASSIAAALVAALAFGSAIWFKKTTARFALVCLGASALVIGIFLRDAQGVAFVIQTDRRLADQSLARALPELLANIYVAALEIAPETRSAALQPIVTSASLQDLTTELETNLAIRVAGGERAMVSSVKEVSLETGRVSANGAYIGLVSWSVYAEAGHWGHNHRRQIEYRAQVEIVPEDGEWKLAAMTVLEARPPDV